MSERVRLATKRQRISYTGLQRGFQDRRDQPLCHPSGKKVGARDSASRKNRSLDFHRDLLSASFAWYSATTRCNSRRTKLERLRSCLAASSSIANKISLGTLLIVSS